MEGTDKKRYLILDCDGVIFPEMPRIIDSFVSRIDYVAGDSYRNQINQQEQERSISVSVAEACRKEHFKRKDQVLEEVFPRFKDRIPYEEQYVLANVAPGFIELITEIWETGLYDEIIVCSHYNVERENGAKARFFEKYLPMIRYVPVKFHLEPYHHNPIEDWKNTERVRSNKIAMLMQYTGINDFSESAFIDDTLSIVNEVRDMVGRCYHLPSGESIIDLLRRVFIESFVEEKEEKKKTKK